MILNDRDQVVGKSLISVSHMTLISGEAMTRRDRNARNVAVFIGVSSRLFFHVTGSFLVFVKIMKEESMFFLPLNLMGVMSFN